MEPAHDGTRILGFEFIEYAAPDPAAFGAYLASLGFTATARHRSKDVVLYRQNGINLIVNSDVESFEQSYSHLRGVRICAIALRVSDAAAAYDNALRNGAWEVESQVRVMEVNIPGIAGAGETVTYFVDRFDHPSIYDIDFVAIPHAPLGAGASLTRIHSITYNVRDGRARECADFSVSVLGLIDASEPSNATRAARSAIVRASDDSVRLRFSEGRPSTGDALFESAQHAALETGEMEATLRVLASNGVATTRVRSGDGGEPPATAGSRVEPRRTARHADTVYFEIVEP